MSHFTVMVIGDDYEEQLAPYHEYECTGVDDEYVIDVDCTDEVNEWMEDMVWVGNDKETGKLNYAWNEKLAKEQFTNCREIPRKQYLEEADINEDEEIRDWFGYKQNRDGMWVHHTNPNAKWDWYQVGGRWSNYFKVIDASKGEHGERSWTNMVRGTTPDRADRTNKGNIDIVGMMDEIRKEKNAQFDLLVNAIGDIPPVSWAEVWDKFESEGKSIDEAREYYHATEFSKAINAYEKEHDVQISGWLGNLYEDYYLHLPLTQARARYVETAAMNVITPYAFVKDGEWVERGQMGWWGMSSNDKDKDEWARQFLAMFNELPDDTMITIVDCHI